MGGTSKDSRKDWGLGGLLLLEDQPDGKAAGTMIWGGLPNLIWASIFIRFCYLLSNILQWVDPTTGICGLFATQVVPTGDAKCAALNRGFEAAIYEQYKRSGIVSPRL